jgi:hypothetical protein
LPDGSWSVTAAARRYAVSRHVVRRWIAAGLVVATKVVLPKQVRTWYLSIDRETDKKLRAIATRRTHTYPKS